MNFQKSSNTAGGLVKLYLLRKEHYKDIRWNHEIGMYVLEKDCINFLEQIYFTLDTGSFSVKHKKGAYQISIDAIYPGNCSAFDELENTPFLLLGYTHNKECLLFGDANNYFIYDYNQDSGSDFEDLNQTKFSLTRLMMMKPRIIQDPFFVEKLPNPFNVNISGSFKLHETLTADYAIDGSKNDYIPLYNWYIADDRNGTNEISVQSGSSNNYKPKNEDSGKYIRVGIQISLGSKFSNFSSSEYYLLERVTIDNYKFSIHAFNVTIVDENIFHVLFEGKNYGNSGKYTLFSAANPIDVVKQGEKLYINFDYKVNAESFIDLEAWPAEHKGNTSTTIGRIHEIDVSSKEVNKWVQISGYINSSQDFDSFVIKTYGDNPIPPEVTLEVKNISIHK